jgi:hypothetical protein
MTYPEPRPIRLTSAIMTLLDPHRGKEASFNRYYETERRFQTVLLGPDAVSSGRFIARRHEKERRFIADDAFDPNRGTFLNLYWLLADPAANTEWSNHMVRRLDELGETNYDRDPFWSFRPLYEWGEQRDIEGVPPLLALDHRFPYLALVRIEPHPDGTAGEASRWYREACATHLLTSGHPASMCLGFQGNRRFTPGHAGDVAPTGFTGEEREVLLFWFFDALPDDTWQEFVARQRELIDDAGIVRLTWASAFVGAIPGTDTYMDELWRPG